MLARAAVLRVDLEDVPREAGLDGFERDVDDGHPALELG
jgi:hypothetical protein